MAKYEPAKSNRFQNPHPHPLCCHGSSESVPPSRQCPASCHRSLRVSERCPATDFDRHPVHHPPTPWSLLKHASEIAQSWQARVLFWPSPSPSWRLRGLDTRSPTADWLVGWAGLAGWQTPRSASHGHSSVARAAKIGNAWALRSIFLPQRRSGLASLSRDAHHLSFVLPRHLDFSTQGLREGSFTSVSLWRLTPPHAQRSKRVKALVDKNNNNSNNNNNIPGT
jgi:hypothetical protein